MHGMTGRNTVISKLDVEPVKLSSSSNNNQGQATAELEDKLVLLTTKLNEVIEQVNKLSYQLEV